MNFSETPFIYKYIYGERERERERERREREWYSNIKKKTLGVQRMILFRACIRHFRVFFLH